MSKRARKMALMGFFQGALSDVMRRREQSRLEEAEARKEARLAAIRAQERNEDREFTLEQFAAQQAALDARDERNFAQQKEFFGIQNEVANARDERNFQQQRQLAAEQRAFTAAEAAKSRATAQARSGGGSSGSGKTPAPKFQAFVGERSGRTNNLNMNDPRHVDALLKWQQTESVRPASPSGQIMDEEAIPGAPAPARQRILMPSGARPPAPASSGPVRINNPSELAKLPSGTRFIAPDGSMRIKP